MADYLIDMKKLRRWLAYWILPERDKLLLSTALSNWGLYASKDQGHQFNSLLRDMERTRD